MTRSPMSPIADRAAMAGQTGRSAVYDFKAIRHASGLARPMVRKITFPSGVPIPN